MTHARSSFQPGDVVARHYGGPAMTVSEITARHVVCDWFEGASWFRNSFKPDQIDNARAVFSRQLMELDRLDGRLD